MENMERLNYAGKKVLVTGHTGFKGSWLCIWLNRLGAEVIGFSLEGHDNDYVYQKTKLKNIMFAEETGDINSYDDLKKVFEEHNPEIVFHLAAQPIVRLSYDEPIRTLYTNTLGTLNVLECIRNTPSVKAAVMITTDKCYKNKEKREAYKESDELGGHDPYSCSKACAEMVIDCYRRSFFNHTGQLVASVRAGNVLGGGDFGKDRLISDCISSLINNKEIMIRNPNAIRPWQFVLDPLYGYLLVGNKLIEGKAEVSAAWNFGPSEESVIPVQEVVNLLIQEWGTGMCINCNNPNEKKHEANLLSLDITRAKTELGWAPLFSIDRTIKNTVEWYKKSLGEDSDKLLDFCNYQIDEYEKLLDKND